MASIFGNLDLVPLFVWLHVPRTGGSPSPKGNATEPVAVLDSQS